MSSRLISTVALIVFCAASASAQTSRPTGAFITRLGKDTLAAERFTVTKDLITGDIVSRTTGRVLVTHYVGELGPNGEFRRTVVSTRIPGDTASSPRFLLVQDFSDTGANVRVMRNGRPDTVNTGWRAYRNVVGMPNVVMEPASYGMYEQILKNTRLGADSVQYVFVSTQKGPQPALWLVRNGKDSVAFTNTVFPGWTEMARVDARGRILALNAGRTTVKTIATRVNDVNIQALASAWQAYAVAHPATRVMSPLDTTKTSVGSANLQVVYSRPSVRGRKIFGSDVVPFGEVWRTGANAATELTTSSDLMIGNTLVPAGKYTLFILPTATDASLIISKMTGEWGTDYDPKADLARVPLTTTTLTSPAELFAIGVTPNGSSAGTLHFSWADREYSVPFTVK
jgi:hypothetical protein